MRAGTWVVAACLCGLTAYASARSEENSAQVAAFTKEFGGLKSELQSRLSQLDDTLKKVTKVESDELNAEGAKGILQDELKSAKSVLSAAGSRLEKVEEQLKGVLQRALSAEDSASHAESELQALREEQGKAMKELKQQIAAAKATQSNTEDMQARADKAEKLTQQLQDQLQSSEKTSSGKLAQLAGKLKEIQEKSQKDLQAASDQAQQFTSKLEAAEKQLREAEEKLSVAEKDSSDTRLNLEQMMIKAEQASAQAQELLKKSLENWLPGWMEAQYDKIAANIRPTLQQVGQATSKYTSGAQASASDWYTKSHKFTSKSWSAYEPHISRLSSDWKGALLTRTASLRENARPTLKAAGQAVLSSTSSIRKQAEQALSGPQLVKLRRHLQRGASLAQREVRKVRRDLERFFAGHMKRFPALVPYTKRPFISWITYALVVGPVVLVVLPLLGGSGSKSSRAKQSAKQSAGRGSPPATVVPQSAAPAKPFKKEKGRKHSEGGDSIRIP